MEGGKKVEGVDQIKDLATVGRHKESDENKYYQTHVWGRGCAPSCESSCVVAVKHSRFHIFSNVLHTFHVFDLESSTAKPEI